MTASVVDDRNVKDGDKQITIQTPYVRPTLNGDVLEWIDESAAGGGLFRRPIDLSTPATNPANGFEMFAPIAGPPMTVVATWNNQAYELRGIAR